jgi:1-acyl-sn-glycerol-3-phosphate acyltransferase
VSVYQLERDGIARRALEAGNRLFCRVYHRLELLSDNPLPKAGPGILVSNHVSGLDPLLIQSVARRVIIWMMAREFHEIPLLHPIFKTVQAIPVERSGRDTAATRAAFRALRDGRLLGIFPEGRIATSRRLLPFQTGAALLAMRAGVKLYPVWLDGTHRGPDMLRSFAFPHEARLAFGPPITPPAKDPNRDDLEATTDRLRSAIEALGNAHGSRFRQQIL